MSRLKRFVSMKCVGGLCLCMGGADQVSLKGEFLGGPRRMLNQVREGGGGDVPHNNSSHEI